MVETAYCFERLGKISRDGRPGHNDKWRELVSITVNGEPMSPNIGAKDWPTLQEAAKKSGFYVVSVYPDSFGGSPVTIAKTISPSLDI